MSDYLGATTTTDEELFCYDSGKGIYLTDQEWLIKQQCRLMLPKIKSHEIQEVINFTKDSSYVDRSIIDTNTDVLNLANRLLNIHTLRSIHLRVTMRFFDLILSPILRFSVLMLKLYAVDFETNYGNFPF